MMNTTRQEILNQVHKTHRDNLKKKLQQRLESARSHGNTKLLSQLEAEAKYLHLN